MYIPKKDIFNLEEFIYHKSLYEKCISLIKLEKINIYIETKKTFEIFFNEFFVCI